MKRGIEEGWTDSERQDIMWHKRHKNGLLNKKCVTPIKAHSPVKIIELY